MNNNNLQKRYFSPKRIFLFTVVALVHVLYAQASNDERNDKEPRTRRFVMPEEFDASATMTGKELYEASKKGIGRMNDDGFIDSVFAKNGDRFGLSPEISKDVAEKVASLGGKGPIFRDVISERNGRNGHRGSAIPIKVHFDIDLDEDISSENDTDEEGGVSKERPSKFRPGFETGHEFKDPFDRDSGIFDDFDENRRFEIDGLITRADAVMTKFSGIFYIFILSVFLFVKLEVFV